MWPFKRRPERPLRDQLIEARDNLRRQIEVLSAGPVKAYAGERQQFAGLARDLSSQLAEIEARLAEIDAAAERHRP